MTLDLFEAPAAAIHVDTLLPCLRNRRWPFDQACHLFLPEPALDLAPLHEFAAKLKLLRSWFQPSPRHLPHYDLTEHKRHHAVRLGAIEVQRQQVVEAMRRWRAFRNPTSS